MGRISLTLAAAAAVGALALPTAASAGVGTPDCGMAFLDGPSGSGSPQPIPQGGSLVAWVACDPSQVGGPSAVAATSTPNVPFTVSAAVSEAGPPAGRPLPIWVPAGAQWYRINMSGFGNLGDQHGVSIRDADLDVIAGPITFVVVAPGGGGGGGGGGGPGPSPGATDCQIITDMTGPTSFRIPASTWGGNYSVLVMCPDSVTGQPTLSGASGVPIAFRDPVRPNWPGPGSPPSGNFWQFSVVGRYLAGQSFSVTLGDPANAGGETQAYTASVYEQPIPGSPSFPSNSNGPCSPSVTNNCYVPAVSVTASGVPQGTVDLIKDFTYGWASNNDYVGNFLAIQVGGGGQLPASVTAALEDKVVTMEFNIGTFDPIIGLVKSGNRGNLSTPNKTWEVVSGPSGPRLRVQIIPKLSGVKWNCSVQIPENCGGASGWADRVGVYPNVLMAELNVGPFSRNRSEARGLTIATTAQDHGPPELNASGALSIQTAGPHWLDFPDEFTWPEGGRRLNRAFINLFLPYALATSPNGFKLPGNEDMAKLIEVLRDGSELGGTQVDSEVVRSGGSIAGVYVSVPDFGFSSPTFVWRKKTAGSSGGASGGGSGSSPATPASPPASPANRPGPPKAKISAGGKSRVVKAVIKPEPNTTYSIAATTGTPAKPSAAKKKKAITRRGSCKADKKKKVVVCSVRLTKGRWTVSITPTRQGVAGDPLRKAVRIR